MTQKRILLLGSGELGKEFVIAAKRLGQYVIACDQYDDAPAMQVADERRVFDMQDHNTLSVVISETNPDIIVPEIEAIATTALYPAEDKGIQVVPSANAVNMTMNREKIRNLASTLGLKTAKYMYAKNQAELEKAVNAVGLPCVVKPLMSSSGHGQLYIKTVDDIAGAFERSVGGARGNSVEVIVEQFIDFKYEFTLLTVTQKNNQPTLYFNPIKHVQKAGDYRESYIAGDLVPDHIIEKARVIANKITEALTGYGIWGVEFFVDKNDTVLFSELSPRPHDTGMVTLSPICTYSEFEVHLRAVLGLPIPNTDNTVSDVGYSAAASAVILSPETDDMSLDYNLKECMAANDTIVRIFGKQPTRPGRRMGVVVCTGIEAADCRYKAKYLASTVLGTLPYTIFEK